MVFSSTIFIFVFLPITFCGYYLLKGELRNYWLLLMSLLFFGWSQPNYLWIIILNIAVNYCGALLLEKVRKYDKIILFVSILINLVILFHFKYFDFCIETINSILKSSFELKDIILPIGISFFTFQGMSYVVDVYKKDVQSQKNPFKVALYITLFPQLIAGPIVRYKDIAFEIDNREVSINDFSEGINRFVVGLAKKAIIANTLAVFVDNVWEEGAGCSSCAVVWCASVAYTLQIFYDFSGYSDMAIGLGRMLGFKFNENFNMPYISESISEFWRRWHISLSTWFRDYVYIPLGGNRRHVYTNLAIVFLLTGIWHGASWHFIIWGIWNGCFILLERFIRNNGRDNYENHLGIWKKIAQKVYTLAVVNFGWIIFRAPTMDEAIRYVLNMFNVVDESAVGYKLLWYIDKWTLLIFIMGILLATSLPKKIVVCCREKINPNMLLVIKSVAILMLFCFSIMRIVSGTYNPFIYFQF